MKSDKIKGWQEIHWIHTRLHHKERCILLNKLNRDAAYYFLYSVNEADCQVTQADVSGEAIPWHLMRRRPDNGHAVRKYSGQTSRLK